MPNYTLKKGTLNKCIFSGEVVENAILNKTSRGNMASVMIELLSNKGQPSYAEIQAFKDNANLLHTVGRKGNVIYVECFVANKIYYNKKMQRRAKSYFVANKIELVERANIRIPNFREAIEILNDINPANFLGKER